MSDTEIGRVRSFNRIVTQRIGALYDEYLARGRPLGASRMLWEIESGPRGGTDLRSLRGRLDLDSGYLSRLLRRLEDEGLVRLEPDPSDPVQLHVDHVVHRDDGPGHGGRCHHQRDRETAGEHPPHPATTRHLLSQERPRQPNGAAWPKRLGPDPPEPVITPDARGTFPHPDQSVTARPG